MDRRTFLKNFAILFGSTAIAAGVRWNIDKISTNLKYRNESTLYLNHLDIHLVEHCNLKCKYCWHFSSIAEKHFYNVKQYEKDMKRLAYVTKGKISEIALLGGEPLLHPYLTKLLNITRFYFPTSRIYIATNGLLLNNMKKDFWDTCYYNDIYIAPSLYPLAIDWESVFNKADKYGVKMITIRNKNVELNINNINQYITNKFEKSKIYINGEQNPIERFKQCYKESSYIHKACNNFVDGKIYPCFVVSNIKHFNKRFNKNIPVTDKDYMDIYKVNQIQDIITFLNNPIPFCKYCRPFEAGRPWERGKQDISEWT